MPARVLSPSTTTSYVHVDGDVPTTTAPDADQLALIDHFDPRGARFRELPRPEVDA